MAYLENNPLAAGLVNKAEDYRWSSAKAHIMGKDESGCLDLAEWNKLASGLDWQNVLSRPANNENISKLRLHTANGRPLGNDEFLRTITSLQGQLPP